MPIDLNIGNFKTREDPSQSFTPTAIVVESDLETVLAITGDGNIDPDFTATDLTGAVNELNSALTNLDAGGVEYDSTESYSSGTVGAELTSQKNTLNHKADVIYDTASGYIASFPDGADGLPAKDLTVGIEPVQDLHGYENPWPGGGGKNKLPVGTSVVSNGITFTVQSAGTVIATGTASGGNARLDITFTAESGTYIANGMPSGSVVDSNYWGILAQGTPSYQFMKYLTDGDSSNTELSSEYEYFYGIRIANGYSCPTGGLLFKPMIRLASVTDATFAPYSNICPISGWTGANVTRTGFNVWDEEWEVGDIDSTTGQNIFGSSTIRSINYTSILPETEYYFKISDTGSYIFRTRFYDANKNYIGYATYGGGSASYNAVFKTPANAYFMRFTPQSSYGARYNNDISINYPSTDTAYHSGTANETIPISWQSEAGTVYGGTLDVTSGVLTVTDANIASYNGETLPGEWISDRDVYAAGTTPTTGAQVVYKLAAPQTYQLDPVTVATLLGQNNIQADCGPVSVEYPADTKLYIQKINTPTDDDMIADAQIASGKYFIVNNNLYLSTTTILAGDPIKPGTNCTLTNLAAALNALNS